VITAPGVPADRVAALREAFMATLRDPEFLAYAQKASLEIAPMDATTLEGLVQELRSTPPAAVELARKLSQ
jgi:tripartite-type tricarboxylate transporter receptor subunit TctC